MSTKKACRRAGVADSRPPRPPAAPPAAPFAGGRSRRRAPSARRPTTMTSSSWTAMARRRRSPRSASVGSGVGDREQGKEATCVHALEGVSPCCLVWGRVGRGAEPACRRIHLTQHECSRAQPAQHFMVGVQWHPLLPCTQTLHPALRSAAPCRQATAEEESGDGSEDEGSEGYDDTHCEVSGRLAQTLGSGPTCSHARPCLRRIHCVISDDSSLMTHKF